MKLSYWFKFISQSFFLGLVGAACITGKWETWPTLLIMGAYVTGMEYQFQKSKDNKELLERIGDMRIQFEELETIVKENRAHISNAQLNNHFGKR